MALELEQYLTLSDFMINASTECDAVLGEEVRLQRLIVQSI